MLANTGKIIEPDKFTKISGRIKDAITTMSDLLTEILVLGKVTSGNLVYTPENVDLIELCEKLVEEFNLIQQDGRTLHFEIVGEPYKMQLDTKLLTHSLSNLISNAFKYSIGKENPKLTIQFKPTELVLSVKDFGLGITKKEQLHLFQPFFRAENVAEIKGTGLGLSIAKEYIEVSKGEITAKSILGEGSCFEITFKR
jgi:signal transduction histidine kinase